MEDKEVLYTDIKEALYGQIRTEDINKVIEMIYFQIERVFNQSGQVISTYWQFLPSEIDQLRDKVASWRQGLIKIGLMPEIPKWPFSFKIKKEESQDFVQLTLF